MEPDAANQIKKKTHILYDHILYIQCSSHFMILDVLISQSIFLNLVDIQETVSAYNMFNI